MVVLGRRPPMPGGGGIGRPLGPSGGRGPGGGGTGLPEGLSGGRVGRWSGGAAGADAAAVSGAWAAGDWAALPPTVGAEVGELVAGGAVAGALVRGRRRHGRGRGPGPGPGRGGRLLTRRDERAGASGAELAADPADAAAGALTVESASWRAGAFLTGADVAPELETATALFGGAGASAPAAATAPSAASALAPDEDSAATAVAPAFFVGAAVFLAAFLAAAGSSGWTGRRNPSASALRRTRSACASSMEDEWLLTPIPRERASSRPSLLVRPSSLASS